MKSHQQTCGKRFSFLIKPRHFVCQKPNTAHPPKNTIPTMMHGRCSFMMWAEGIVDGAICKQLRKKTSSSLQMTWDWGGVLPSRRTILTGQGGITVYPIYSKAHTSTHSFRVINPPPSIFKRCKGIRELGGNPPRNVQKMNPCKLYTSYIFIVYIPHIKFQWSYSIIYSITEYYGLSWIAE